MSDSADQGTKENRRGGRPKGNEGPMVPWQEVDRLLVFGEVAQNEESGREDVRYPTYRELGNRYGVSGALIGKYSKEHQCLKRREENRQRVQLAYEQKVIEARAEARAVSATQTIEIVDEYLHGFHEALADGRVRTDSASDFNTMARLKEFLAGRADSRQEVHSTITLEQIQERHAAMRAQLDGLDPALTGEVVDEPAELATLPAKQLPAADAPEHAVASSESPQDRRKPRRAVTDAEYVNADDSPAEADRASRRTRRAPPPDSVRSSAQGTPAHAEREDDAPKARVSRSATRTRRPRQLEADADEPHDTHGHERRRRQRAPNEPDEELATERRRPRRPYEDEPDDGRDDFRVIETRIGRGWQDDDNARRGRR
jgi:hypothetical protein